METTKKVEIRGIDTNSVEKDDSFPSALAFYVELSEVPDSIWRELFLSQYEQSWYNLKREVRVHGHKIRVVSAPGEEQGQVDFIKRVVQGTNEVVGRYNTEVMRQRELEKKGQEGQTKIMEEAKERLRKVKV